jgi:general secretion pathway protein A
MKFSDFGFKDNPFSITPDPRYLFLSRGHEESLAHLIYGTGPNGGFVLLTGEVGTGKTLLLRSLLAQQLENNVDIALVLNPRLSRREFLATICDELGIHYKGPPYSLKNLSDLLTRHLLKTHSEGKHTVLVVDEAQNLSPRVLEQVRLLTNLETSKHKLLRIILVGQPELLQILARKELRQVDQRITARYHLSPLNARETRAYVIHRLAVAGVREDLFTPLALRILHYATGGVPRMINTICERTLLAVYTAGQQRISASMMWKAAQEVRGWKYKRNLVLPLGIGGALLLVLVVGGWFWYQHSSTTLNTNLLVPRQPARQEIDRAPTPSNTQSSSKVNTRMPQTMQNGAKSVTMHAAREATHQSMEMEPSEIDLPKLFSRPQNTFYIFQQLFHTWDSNYHLNLSVPPCAQASKHGLRCLIDNADWKTLMRMNRPVLIRLKKQRQERMLVVKHIDQGWLLVDTGEEEGIVQQDRLKSYWKGGYVMLWRPHTGLALIGEGSTGKAVIWLRQRLQAADGIAMVEKAGLERFDRALQARLEKFQKQNGLEADGVAGQQTQIYLNNLNLPKGTPVLLSVMKQGET